MATIVAGVDGCKAGWFVGLWNVDENTFTYRIVPDIWAVRTFAATAQVIAVDIPIGLLDHAVPGGRACDNLARKMLGPKRASSVFSPPVRAALECAAYADALNANRDSSHIVTQALRSRIAGVAKDDILDACAACWTARRISMGVATPVPAVSPLDSRGLRMEMWY